MVYQRKWCKCEKKCQHSKRWWYDFSVRGKRFRTSVPEAHTKLQAEQAEARAKNNVFDGKYGREPSAVMLREFIASQYIPFAKAEKRSWQTDMGRLKPILAHFRNKRMRDVTQQDVVVFRRILLNSKNKWNRPYAPSTVDLIVLLLSRVYSLAIENGVALTNPCSRIGRCSSSTIMHDYMTADEEAKLWPVLVGKWAYLADALQVDLYTGMRKRELLGLHVSQVEFSHQRILLTKTKSGRPRFIPIHEDIEPVLRRLVESAGPNGYLFESPQTGKPIFDLYKAWRKALKVAGLRNIKFHVAGRHTFGTRAAENGANITDVQDILGHASVTTTMRYVHATEAGKRRAVDAVAKARQSNVVTFPVHKATGTNG